MNPTLKPILIALGIFQLILAMSFSGFAQEKSVKPGINDSFKYPTKTMTSLFRALKPGGRVVVIDFNRVEGQSTPWVMSHVRAGQEVFEKEILDCGFTKLEQKDELLKENYFLVFQKLKAASASER